MLRAVGFLRGSGRWKEQRARGDCTRATHGLPPFALARLPFFLFPPFRWVCRLRRVPMLYAKMAQLGAWGMRWALGGSARCARRMAVSGGIFLHSPLSWFSLGPSSFPAEAHPSSPAHSSALFPEVHPHGASPLSSIFPLFLRSPLPSDLQRRKWLGAQ
ncbi:hypothetical protein B0H13DRAFT_882218 [Mycena leptocephala]|nr:hypothetical protein B0H13DRAFT_127026 [Mycena leptocephala]KAJ7889691.1 hypothetical protein B0H13DRAFT_882218 [Mycena leptocephala]